MGDLGTKENPYDFRKLEHLILAKSNGSYVTGDEAVSVVQKQLLKQDKNFKGLNDFWTNVVKKEGFVDGYYLDTLGILTRGVGQTNEFLDGEYSLSGFPKAINKVNIAVDKQYNELNKTYQVNPELKKSLYSVNFQLGTNWNTKFKGVWNGLVNQDFDSAINNIKYADPNDLNKGTTPWYQQTTNRAEDFIKAIKVQKDNMQIKSSNEDHIITSSMAEQIHKDIKKELFK